MAVVKSTLQRRIPVGLGQATKNILAVNANVAGQRVRRIGGACKRGYESAGNESGDDGLLKHVFPFQCVLAHVQ